MNIVKNRFFYCLIATLSSMTLVGMDSTPKRQRTGEFQSSPVTYQESAASATYQSPVASQFPVGSPEHSTFTTPIRNLNDRFNSVGVSLPDDFFSSGYSKNGAACRLESPTLFEDENQASMSNDISNGRTSSSSFLSSSSSSSNMTEKERKEAKKLYDVQANNKISGKQITGILESNQKLRSPEIGLIKTKIECMKKTPNRTKETVARVVAASVKKSIIEKKSDTNTTGSVKKGTGSAKKFRKLFPEIDENDKIIASLASKSSAAGGLLQVVGRIFESSPERRSISAVNTKHVCYPDYKEDGSLGGGHNLDAYSLGKISQADKPFDCFVSQDNKTIGVYVDGIHPKTVKPGFTEQKVISNLRDGRSVATSPVNQNFNISEVSPNEFVASYKNKSNQLIEDTQYPILVVDTNVQDNSGNVYIGKFAKLKSKAFSKDGFDTENESPVKIPNSTLDSMMRAGERLGIKKEGYSFFDITPQITSYLFPYLDSMGQTKLPGDVYAIKKFESEES